MSEHGYSNFAHAQTLRRHREALNREIASLLKQVREVDALIVEEHRASLDEGAELPEGLLQGIKVRVDRRGHGWLVPSAKFKGELLGADPDCVHQILEFRSSVGCTRCRGWYYV